MRLEFNFGKFFLQEVPSANVLSLRQALHNSEYSVSVMNVQVDLEQPWPGSWNSKCTCDFWS